MEFNVELNKAEVLKTLAENKARHTEIFQEAIDKYRERAIFEFSTRIDDLKAGKLVDTIVRLDQPVDHTEHYQHIIDMLERHVSETVMVSEADYINFILDQWNWTKQFLDTATRYTGKFYR